MESKELKALFGASLCVGNYLNHVTLKPNASMMQKMKAKDAVGYRPGNFETFARAKINKLQGKQHSFPTGTSPSVEAVIKCLEAQGVSIKQGIHALHTALQNVSRIKVWTLEADIDAMQNRIQSIHIGVAKVDISTLISSTLVFWRLGQILISPSPDLNRIEGCQISA